MKKLLCLLLVLILLPAAACAKDNASDIRVLLRRLNLTDRADMTLSGRWLVRSASGMALLLSDGVKVTVRAENRQLILYAGGVTAAMGTKVSFLRQESGDTVPGIRFNLQAGFYPGDLTLTLEGMRVRVLNTKKEVFFDKLTYIYLEMPKFKKTETELKTLFDKWLYALKNLPRLMERPASLQERIFKKFFDVAQTANLSQEEYFKYFESEKVYYDLDGAFRTASNKGFAQGMRKGMEKGMQQGMEKGMQQGMEKANRDNALRMKADGMPADLIAKYTGLSAEEIDKL